MGAELRWSAALTREGAARSMLGLGVSALADAQRLLEERVERRPDGAVLLAEAQRVAGLAEDLALPEDHRLQAGRDAEEVGHRALVVVDVEVREDSSVVWPARSTSRRERPRAPWKRSTSA